MQPEEGASEKMDKSNILESKTSSCDKFVIVSSVFFLPPQFVQHQ